MLTRQKPTQAKTNIEKIPYRQYPTRRKAHTNKILLQKPAWTKAHIKTAYRKLFQKGEWSFPYVIFCSCAEQKSMLAFVRIGSCSFWLLSVWVFVCARICSVGLCHLSICLWVLIQFSPTICNSSEIKGNNINQRIQKNAAQTI